MANLVVILGAGASADFGVPTLRGLFKDVQARTHLRVDRQLQGYLNDLFWTPRGHTLETSEQSLTVEEMLTLIQDWEREEGLRERPDRNRCDDLKRRLYVLIEKAVFKDKSSRAAVLNQLIKVCRYSFEHTTWASFNWDCIFEASFYYDWSDNPLTRMNPTIPIPLRDWRNGTASHEYLKLHGSVSWWMIENQLTYLSWGRGGGLSQKWLDYERATTADYPVILEPSSYKYGGREYEILKPQWDRFLQRLSEATHVLIVGYSLPDGDTQARSKILTSFQVNTDCKWGVIDPSPDISGRFERLLGNVRLKTLQMGLAGVNGDIIGNLRTLFDDVELRDRHVPPPPPPVPAR